MKRALSLLACGLAPWVSAKEFSSEDIAFFTKEVRPLLEDHCIRCHGGKDSTGHYKVKSGLQLVSRKGIVNGGDHRLDVKVMGGLVKRSMGRDRQQSKKKRYAWAG